MFASWVKRAVLCSEEEGDRSFILDNEEFQKTNYLPDKLALKLCDRHFGIGADGLIIVNPNNPIGNAFTNDEMEKIIEKTRLNPDEKINGILNNLIKTPIKIRQNNIYL